MKIIKSFFVFALGIGVGAGVSYIATKEKYEQLINDEVQDVKDAYNAKYDALVEQYEELVKRFEENGVEIGNLRMANDALNMAVQNLVRRDKNVEESTSQNASVTHQEARRAILVPTDEENIEDDEKPCTTRNKTHNTNKIDYSKIIQNEGCGQVMSNENGKNIVNGVTEGHTPYVLDNQDDIDYSEYDKVELLFYDIDGVLTDEDGDVIRQQEMFPGICIRDSFGLIEYSPDEVFIRDDDLKIDYNVVRVLRSFKEYGFEEPEFGPEE